MTLYLMTNTIKFGTNKLILENIFSNWVNEEFRLLLNVLKLSQFEIKLNHSYITIGNSKMLLMITHHFKEISFEFVQTLRI